MRDLTRKPRNEERPPKSTISSNAMTVKAGMPTIGLFPTGSTQSSAVSDGEQVARRRAGETADQREGAHDARLHVEDVLGGVARGAARESRYSRGFTPLFTRLLELVQEIVLALEDESLRQCTSSFFSVIATTGRNLANRRNIMKKNPKVPMVMLISTGRGL